MSDECRVCKGTGYYLCKTVYTIKSLSVSFEKTVFLFSSSGYFPGGFNCLKMPGARKPGENQKQRQMNT